MNVVQHPAEEVKQVMHHRRMEVQYLLRRIWEWLFVRKEVASAEQNTLLFLSHLPPSTLV